MSYISSGVEYALHCLLYLSQPINAKGVSVRDLAELQNIPIDYLAKIFTKLHKAGIVIATEGIKGGFSLAKTADQISVHDVIVAIDNYKPLFKCKEIRSGCAVFDKKIPAEATQGTCTIHAIMLDAEQQLRDTLSQQSLADIAQKVTKKLPKDYPQQVIKWLDHRTINRQPNNK
ncbi:Rrf2 family transcriptional regulator [Entomomonas sp. E2T0]|uniref:RrF2 family transcriptional regulator n=1 Tax=Entomomonas sp. E2T0 TaxID=2930213 RepID=UPI00222838EB|nr:Rrf2 family transcriptional regulator [Entomomonas sp. E2T0]UYZ84388.1 Rrf2 family transcriptional regulator [Entomomonas sp. E2T0]